MLNSELLVHATGTGSLPIAHENYHRALRNGGTHVCFVCCKFIGWTNDSARPRFFFPTEESIHRPIKVQAGGNERLIPRADQSKKAFELDTKSCISTCSDIPVDQMPLSPPTQDLGKCPRCGAEGYEGQCHSCSQGTSISQSYEATPITANNHAQSDSSPRQYADKCPCRGVEGSQGQCYSCQQGTGVSQSLHPSSPGTNSLRAIFERLRVTPTQLADKCPRCGAEGYQGQCYSCQQGTGVGQSYQPTPAVPSSLRTGLSHDDFYPQYTGEKCPRCSAENFTGQCYTCGFNTVINHSLYYPRLISPQRLSRRFPIPTPKSSPPSPELEEADICPHCGAEGCQSHCHSCGEGTGIGQPCTFPSPNTIHRTFFYPPSTPSPDLDEADTCPRCGASGYQGQCHSCSQGTGVGLSLGMENSRNGLSVAEKYFSVDGDHLTDLEDSAVWFIAASRGSSASCSVCSSSDESEEL